MSISIDDLFVPLTADDYVAQLLTLGQSLGLTTTSWQSGGVTRTILALVANLLASADKVVSVFAHGGFLKSAASVTPEGGPGWLDVVADSIYDEQRAAAGAAQGTLAITNASASIYGPFAAGTYHVYNPATKATYSNAASLTIGASTVTSAPFIADAFGSASTSGSGAITGTTTSLIGVTVTNAAAFVGTDADSNAALVTKCLLKLASFAQRTGPIDAYVYFALNAAQYLAPGAALDGGKITRARADGDALTGVVTVTIANLGGVPDGGDVTKVNTVLQAQCVPDAVTAVTQAATNFAVLAAVEIYVPVAFVAAATTAAAAAIDAYFANLPLGGTLKGAPPGVVSFDGFDGAIVSAIVALGVPVTQIDTTVTLNGGTSDLTMTAVEVATLDPGSTLIGHGV